MNGKGREKWDKTVGCLCQISTRADKSHVLIGKCGNEASSETVADSWTLR